MPDYRVIDADGHVDPAPVCDWKKYVRSPFGAIADEMAKKGYDVNGDRTTTRRGGFDPAARIADMDEEGIDVTVLLSSAMRSSQYLTIRSYIRTHVTLSMHTIIALPFSQAVE